MSSNVSRPVTIKREDVVVDGGELACFRLGESEGRPLAVAVHGITANSRAWLPVARALGDRAGLFALDLRGRSRSSALPGPYGIEAHVHDLLAAIDALELERVVLAGHSLGAYIVVRFAASYPDRVQSLVLVDGGLPIPGGEDLDLDEFLGPTLARLKLRFADRAAYRAWWREHPAVRDSDIADQDLFAYADHDLVGPPPEMRPSVAEEAVRADGADLVHTAEVAYSLDVAARLLCAPRGLMDGPNPMQPLALAQSWAAQRASQREATLVPDVNHYSITLGARGARAVADAIAAACS
jgi:pimeloyl-ACP methyl ester carboxylesterase